MPLVVPHQQPFLLLGEILLSVVGIGAVVADLLHNAQLLDPEVVLVEGVFRVFQLISPEGPGALEDQHYVIAMLREIGRIEQGMDRTSFAFVGLGTGLQDNGILPFRRFFGRKQRSGQH